MLFLLLKCLTYYNNPNKLMIIMRDQTRLFYELSLQLYIQNTDYYQFIYPIILIFIKDNTGMSQRLLQAYHILYEIYLLKNVIRQENANIVSVMSCENELSIKMEHYTQENQKKCNRSKSVKRNSFLSNKNNNFSYNIFVCFSTWISSSTKEFQGLVSLYHIEYGNLRARMCVLIIPKSLTTFTVSCKFQ